MFVVLCAKQILGICEETIVSGKGRACLENTVLLGKENNNYVTSLLYSAKEFFWNQSFSIS